MSEPIKTFTASNGYVVEDISTALLVSDPNYDLCLQLCKRAIREYFQHERDVQLGRWRDPKFPDWVVYPVGNDSVDVLRETSVSTSIPGPGRACGITRKAAEEWRSSAALNFYEAARRYFAAHPKPKPWLEAKPGEGWVITLDGVKHPATVYDPGTGEHCFDTGGMVYNVKNPSITAGYRIYPTEGASE